MAFLLDTDHFSLIQEDISKAPHLQARLRSISQAEIHVSIISFQEQARGWLAWINSAKKPHDVVLGFRQLQLLIRDYSKMPVLPFDASALDQFTRLKQRRVRIGTSDLRIASIAIVHGATVLTRNLRDFRQVPGLAVEDWTVP